MISDSKFNNSFLVQLEISGYTTRCKFDRNSNGREILIYIREDIATKTLHVPKLATIGKIFSWAKLAEIS